MSPDQLEAKIIRAEQRLILRLSTINRLWLSAIVTLFIFIYSISLGNWQEIAVYGGSSLAVLFANKDFLNFILPAALLINLIPPLQGTWFAFILITMGSTSALHWSSEAWCSTESIFSFPLFIFLSTFLVWSVRKKWLGFWPAIGVSTVLFCVLGGINSARVIPLSCSQSFWTHKPQFYLLVVYSFLCQPAEQMNLRLLYSPAHDIYPAIFYFPFPKMTSPLETAFARGLVKIFKAFLLLTVLLNICHYITSYRGSLLYVLRVDFSNILSSMVVGNLAVGLTELFGIKCPPATYFLPLARSPRDFLKRETIYAYIFHFRSIYMPALALFRSPLIASLLFFLCFPFYHNGLELLFNGTPGPPGTIQQIILTGSYHWGVWFLAFWFAERGPFKNLFGTNRWRSVVMTNLCMMAPWIFEYFYLSLKVA
jgi:hypothetical protein